MSLDKVFYIQKTPAELGEKTGFKFDVEVAGFGWMTSIRRAGVKALENTLADVASNQELPSDLRKWVGDYRLIVPEYGDLNVPGIRVKDFDYWLRMDGDPVESPKMALAHLSRGRTYRVWMTEDLARLSLPVYMLASIRQRDKKAEWREFIK